MSWVRFGQAIAPQHLVLLHLRLDFRGGPGNRSSNVISSSRRSATAAAAAARLAFLDAAQNIDLYAARAHLNSLPATAAIDLGFQC